MMKKYQLDTPCLVLNLEVFEENLRIMRELAAAAGKKLRPHIKTHKCPEIAKRQLEAGNCAGVCTAKVSEAVELLRAGIAEVLITSPVATPAKIELLMDWAVRSPGLMVVVDHAENAKALNAAAEKRGVVLPVLVDVNPEMGRTGVAFEKALPLGRLIAKLPGLKLMGIQCYAGMIQHIADYAERRAESLRLMQRAAELVRKFRKAGLNCEVFTGTGTGTSDIDLAIPELTDIQVGSYCVMDAEYTFIGANGREINDRFRPALTVLSSVVSVNQPNYVTIDAGLKALYFTPNAPPRVLKGGMMAPGWEYDWFGDEHGKLTFPGAKPKLGDVVELVMPHCDPTINLYDEIFVVDGDDVVNCWPIALRGKCR